MALAKRESQLDALVLMELSELEVTNLTLWAAIRKIAFQLPPSQKPAFRKIIVAVAEHVKKQAEEIRSTAADLQEMYLQMERVIAP